MIICNRFELVSKLSSGSFGSVYKGRNIRSDELVAIKVEPLKNQTNLLIHEAQVYQYLGNTKGFAYLKWFGKDDNNYYLIINMLGTSLLDLFKFNIEIATNIVYEILIQMIEIMRTFHENGLIHRDVKPDNWLFGVGSKKKQLHLVDFGFTKRYLTNTNEHMALSSISSVIGTPNYVSLNVHNLVEPSRRDDLESVLYIAIKLYMGKLPWEINPTNMVQQKTHIEQNNYIPVVFRNLIHYVRSLDFDSPPDYEKMITYVRFVAKEQDLVLTSPDDPDDDSSEEEDDYNSGDGRLGPS